jgi:hypothetical protein
MQIGVERLKYYGSKKESKEGSKKGKERRKERKEEIISLCSHFKKYPTYVGYFLLFP